MQVKEREQIHWVLGGRECGVKSEWVPLSLTSRKVMEHGERTVSMDWSQAKWYSWDNGSHDGQPKWCQFLLLCSIAYSSLLNRLFLGESGKSAVIDYLCLLWAQEWSALACKHLCATIIGDSIIKDLGTQSYSPHVTYPFHFLTAGLIFFDAMTNHSRHWL